MLRSPEFDFPTMPLQEIQPSPKDLHEITDIVDGNSDVISQLLPSISSDIVIDCSRGQRRREQEQKGNNNGQRDKIERDITNLEHQIKNSETGQPTLDQQRDLTRLKGLWSQLKRK